MLRRQAREAFFLKRRQVKLNMQEDLKDQRNFFLKLNKLNGTVQKLKEIMDKFQDHMNHMKTDVELDEMFHLSIQKYQRIETMMDECLDIWEQKRELIQSRQNYLVEHTHCVTNSDGEEFFEMDE